MEGSSPRPFQRVFRASSEGPVPPARSAGEDGDAFTTRKRPRLDSGDRVYRSLSAEASSINPEPPSLSFLRQSIAKEAEQGIAMEDQTQSTTSPRSKVTLNIKGQPAISQHEETEMETESSQVQVEIPDSQEALPRTQSLTSHPRTPSDLGSPDIEVAEPEDATGYLGPTIWKRPGEKSIDARRILLMDVFPMLQETEDWRHVLQRIGMALQWDDGDIGYLLDQISDFIDQWLLLADECPLKIWELWSPDSDLWNNFGIINEALLKRNSAATIVRSPLGNMLSNEIDLTEDEEETSKLPLNNDRTETDPLLRFLRKLVAILTRLLQMDCQTLIETKHDSAEPDLGGKFFVLILNSYVIGGMNNQCREFLWRMYSEARWTTEDILNVLMTELLQSNGLQNLIDCTRFLIERSPTDLEYAASLVTTAAGILLWSSRIKEQLPEVARRTYNALSKLYVECAEKFERSIKKQAAGFTIEVITRFVGGLSECLKYLCALDYQQTIQLLAPNFDHELHKYLPEDAGTDECAVELVTLKMKLETAFLCMKNGRMESRVAGVEAFGDLLLNVFRRYFQGRREGEELHFVVSFCKDFIQDRDLISYLVGVGSHPQIVSRSKNILGFQVVTHSYLQRDTDTIWAAMRSSQDPRRSEAIMDILMAQVEYSDATFLQSFVEKLIDLPVDAYDGKMRFFTKQLLHSAPRAGRRGPQLLETICTKILIPVLQKCLQCNSLSLKEKKERWYFAFTELRAAAGNQDFSIAAKSQISALAVQSIEEGSHASTAGIAVLGVLIDVRYYGYEHDGRPYCMTEKFADLLVRDLGECNTILRATNLEEEDIAEVLRPRLDLIERCLQTLSLWPYENCMERLWQSLVGNGAVNDRARDHAYRMLARLMHATNLRRIKFLDECLQVFFEKLESQNMTGSVLEFGKEASAYYERFLRKKDGSESSLAPLPGDMFWHISLVAEIQDIAEKATKAFVDLNLPRSPESSSSSNTTTKEQNHVRLVDRCVATLTGAANKVKQQEHKDEGSESVAVVDSSSDAENQAARTLFSRSLYVLKQFLAKIRDQRLGSPLVRNDSPLSEHSIHGREIEFSFHKPPPKSQIKQILTIGSESTLNELVARLCRATGYSQIKIISGGASVDLEQNAVKMLKDIPNLSSSRHLLIAKGSGGRILKEETYNTRLLPLEQQVLIHFDKLYDLLSLNDTMGREACTFLMTFPPKQEILSKPSSELLRLEFPYRSIYSCYTMKKKLSSGLKEGASCEDDLRMIVRCVGDALIRFIATTGSYFTSPADLLLCHLTDCLETALKESVPGDVARTYFSDAPVFMHSVLKLLETTLTNDGSRDTTPIVRYCFSIALEACFKSNEAWVAFKSYNNIKAILKASWLSSPSQQSRSNTAQAMKSICAALPLLQSIDSGDFLNFVWQQVLVLVPMTRHFPKQSTQFFDIAMTVFRLVGEHSSSTMPLNEYVRTWSTLLLSHRPQGSSPNNDQDTVVDGLTDMLGWTLQLIKSRHQSIEGTVEVMQAIFNVHAFPCNRLLGDEDEWNLHVPVLSSPTRSKIYNLLLSLTTDQATFAALISVLGQVIPDPGERNGAWSSGIAQPLEELTDPIWLIDRDHIVRTAPGYAGLKNLSNTCYLNSLFEQLFMNTRFRHFMLHANIVDPDRGQSLLYETQRLFAYQQETWLKCVDPSNVVENIITFDAEPIDVTVQMDVDEFYNLLFDRWENQLSSSEEKKAFRKFYGGELVQQIKSQDCDHVSERVEPFSVIQCEIQGKSGLADSLNAFIEGEMMQGDNKYKCSSCDAYVNAVKRACLKQVPNNIIFHLKRFDFDLVHGTRHKINDQFEFPMEIDLAPYNIAFLQDPSTTPEPDPFILVGILIHSGTAEVGHYYSYVRERPGIKATWVEMNDADVSAFDPATIPHYCFGGWDQSPNPGWQKANNAYMLFYQRIGSLEEEVSIFPTGTDSPVKTHIPLDLSSQLVAENEVWIRKYCLLDSSYVKFSRDILDKYRDLHQDHCSEGHIIEAKLIQDTVRQLELLFARLKDAKHVDDLLRSLEKLLRRCSRCMTLFLSNVTSEGTFRNLLFRCPQDVVKQRLAEEILQGLSLLKEQDPVLYEGQLSSPSSPSSEDNVYGSIGAFQEILSACDQVVETIPLLGKGWDDFWSFLCKLGRRGRWELSQLQEHGYFSKALQVISYSGGIQQQAEWSFANSYLKYRTRKRYNMANVANLLVMIFEGYFDLTLEPDNDRSDRVYLSDFELKLLSHNVTGDQKGRSSTSVILAGFLSIYDLDVELYRKIMMCYMRLSTQPAALRSYQTCLFKGASISPANLAAPYLIAASVFIEQCEDERAIMALVNRLAEAVQSIGDDGGEEHLRFFHRLTLAENLNFAGLQPPFLRQLVVKKLSTFAPHLLCYCELGVRAGAAELVNGLVLGVDTESLEDPQEIDEIVINGKLVTRACLQKLIGIIEARKLYDIRRLDELLDVIRNGLTKFFDNETDRIEHDRMQAQFEQCTDVVPHIAAQSPDGVESVEYSDSDELTDISIIPG